MYRADLVLRLSRPCGPACTAADRTAGVRSATAAADAIVIAIARSGAIRSGHCAVVHCGCDPVLVLVGWLWSGDAVIVRRDRDRAEHVSATPQNRSMLLPLRC